MVVNEKVTFILGFSYNYEHVVALRQALYYPQPFSSHQIHVRIASQSQFYLNCNCEGVKHDGVKGK